MNWVHQNCSLMPIILRLGPQSGFQDACRLEQTSSPAQDQLRITFCKFFGQNRSCDAGHQDSANSTNFAQGRTVHRQQAQHVKIAKEQMHSLCHIQPHSCSSNTWQVRKNAKHIKNSDDCIHAVSLPCATTQSAQERV